MDEDKNKKKYPLKFITNSNPYGIKNNFQIL